MAQRNACRGCEIQMDNIYPHECLREISHLPSVSTLYICNECKNLWLLETDAGWKLAEQKVEN